MHIYKFCSLTLKNRTITTFHSGNVSLVTCAVTLQLEATRKTMESEIQYANLPRVYTPSPTTPSAQQQLRENDENDYEKLRQHVASSPVSGPARNPPSYSPTASTFYSSAAAAAAANPALGPQQYPPPPPQYPPPAEAYAGQVPYGRPLAGYPPQCIAPPPPPPQQVIVSATMRIT